MKTFLYFFVPFILYVSLGLMYANDTIGQLIGQFVIFIFPLLLCGLIAYYFFIKPIFFD
jgi:hypothetical protein